MGDSWGLAQGWLLDIGGLPDRLRDVLMPFKSIQANRDYQREYARVMRSDPLMLEAMKAKGRASRKLLRWKRADNPGMFPVKKRYCKSRLKREKHGYYLKYKEKRKAQNVTPQMAENRRTHANMA